MMPTAPLVAHSLAEAYLYLMATPCAACEKGPLKGSDAQRVGHGADLVVRMNVTCSGCGAATALAFRLPQDLGTDDHGGTTVVNPTDDPSCIVDVAQWVTLSRVIAEAAGKETDKVQARHLGLEATLCLEEALKFYDNEDNDLPSPAAFFHDASRRRFREHPEQFSRQRLLSLRGKLPALAVMQSRLSPKKSPGKRWWRRHRE